MQTGIRAMLSIGGCARRAVLAGICCIAYLGLTPSHALAAPGLEVTANAVLAMPEGQVVFIGSKSYTVVGLSTFFANAGINLLGGASFSRHRDYFGKAIAIVLDVSSGGYLKHDDPALKRSFFWAMDTESPEENKVFGHHGVLDRTFVGGGFGLVGVSNSRDSNLLSEKCAGTRTSLATCLVFVTGTVRTAQISKSVCPVCLFPGDEGYPFLDVDHLVLLDDKSMRAARGLWDNAKYLFRIYQMAQGSSDESTN